MLGACGTDATGSFIGEPSECTMVRPLAEGECIRAYSTQYDLVSPMCCVTTPAPAPALSWHARAAALILLICIGRARLRRARAD